MKKIKLITPIVLTATAGTIVPVVSVTSCSKSLTNLMKEYTPSIAQLKAKSFASPDKVLEAYLDAVKENKDIFKQDLLYTLSRGLPQYLAYMSEHCEIKNFDASVDISDISVDKDSKTITCDVTFKLKYDFTGTKIEELEWYDISAIKANTKQKIRLYLDFNTYSNAFKFSPYAQRRQMTTFAGATQFGISEINSRLKLISEKGSYTDLNGKSHSVDLSEEENTHHFILPNLEYWETYGGGVTEYWKRYNEVASLWTSNITAQILVLILKYYMSYDAWSDIVAPSTLRLGSYYMANATLNNLYNTTPSGDTISIDSFNLSLDSIHNAQNLKNSGQLVDGVYSIPNKIDDKNVSTIRTNAFNGDASTYTNLGLPDAVKEIKIIGGVATGAGNSFKVQNGAFKKNYWLKKITFIKPTGTITQANNYPEVGSDAFVSMHAVDTIDFSDYDPSAATLLKSADNFVGAFSLIHSGTPVPADGKWGTIRIPASASQSDWKTFLENAGLHIKETDDDIGWVIE